MNIASIDIGSNTVILLIAEINGKNLRTIHNDIRIPRLGKGLIPGGNITNDKINQLVTILTEFKTLIDRNNCSKCFAVATNALRIASNGEDIISLIESKIGVRIEIISGNEEANYSFQGAVSNIDIIESDILVIDIGGGSTEIIYGKPDIIIFRRSFSAGVVSGTEEYFKHNPPLQLEIDLFTVHLTRTFKEINFTNPLHTIAIAGTPTTLACIQKRLNIYNEDEIEGYVLNYEDIRLLKEELSGLSSNQILAKYKEVVYGREDVLLAGTIILLELMNVLKIPKIVVSTRGIRYGVIYNKILGKQ